MNPNVVVLMIEDNQGDVVLMQAAMEKACLTHEIAVVADGIEAVEFLHRRGKYFAAPRPGLILLDLKLPKQNGREVLAEIRPDPALHAIPIILLSSSRSELELAKEFGLPADCYVEKPSTFQGFVQLAEGMEQIRTKAAMQTVQGDAC